MSLPASGEIDQIVNIETNLALLLYQQGQYGAAKIHCDAGTLAARDSKDDNVIAYTWFVRGLLASRQVRRPEAARILVQARQLATDPDLRTDTENALARWYSAKHQPRRAELWYRRSVQTFERKRSSVQDEALRLPSFAYGDSIYRDYAEFLIDSHRSIEALQLLDPESG